MTRHIRSPHRCRNCRISEVPRRGALCLDCKAAEQQAVTRISRENGEQDSVTLNYAVFKLAGAMEISPDEVKQRLTAGETLFTVSYLYRMPLSPAAAASEKEIAERIYRLPLAKGGDA